MRTLPRTSSSAPARIGGMGLVAAIAASLTIAEPAGAHTGLPAGGALDGAWHPVLGLDHLLAMVAVGILAAMAHDRRAGWLTPVGFLGGMVGGAALGFAGVDLPAAELVVAASVLVLGLLVLTLTQHRGLWLVAVAAAFGTAHGFAHGAELPTGAVPVAYALGFVATTAVLHLAGAGIGLASRRLPATRVAAGTLVSAVGAVLLLGG